jgi:hypothetical protein
MTHSVCAALILLAPMSVSAQRPPSLRAQLEAELLNKELRSKVILGNAMRVRDPTDRGERVYLLDTELSLNGAYRLEQRISGFRGPVDLSSTFETYPRSTIHRLPEGTMVKVTDVELKSDRLEVWLRDPAGAYAKLKYMLGQNWQRTMKFDDVMFHVSAGLLIEKYEVRRGLASSYALLKKGLADLDAKARPEDLQGRVESAQALVDTLRGLISNRTQHDAATGSSSTNEIGEYERRLRTADEALKKLQDELRTTQVAAIRERLATEGSRTADARRQLGSPPKTIAEWGKQSELIEVWLQSAERRAQLIAELAGHGERDPTHSESAVKAELEEIGRRRAGLDQLKSKLELADLDSRYQVMEKQGRSLLDAYTRAFGTPKQRETAARAASHLEAMIANRIAAGKLGARTDAVIAALRKQLTAVRR